MFKVSKNNSGATLAAREFDDLAEAVAYAAKLAAVTPKTIRRRMQAWAHPSGAYQVGGPETGDIGVWIEYD